MNAGQDGPGISVPLRWRDLDALGHVYHAEALTLLDEARTRWLREVVGLPSPDAVVIRRVELDYLGEILLELGSVVVHHRVLRVGGSSLTVAEQMTSPAGAELLRCVAVLVRWSPAEHRKRPWDGPEHALLTELAGSTPSVETPT